MNNSCKLNYNFIPRHSSIDRVSGQRTVFVNEIQPTKFGSNKISTGKYTVLSFLPKFLFEQFRKYANIFFFVIALFQQIPNVSPTGRFTTVVPLSLIILVSAIKELIEDFRRHAADGTTNNTKTLILRENHWVEVPWKHAKVGDVVKVLNNYSIPADLLLLSSSEPSAMCYIETSNLDGETNLKLRQGLPITADLLTPADVKRTHMKVECENPNRKLDKFVGTLYVTDISGCTGYSLRPNQILLRGSSLKNTNWIFGVILYTGMETKVMLNSSTAPLKQSTVDKQTNYYILVLFGLLAFLTLFTVTANAIWTHLYAERLWYLGETGVTAAGVGYMLITAFIIFHTIIPISLQVTLEVVRFIQALFINWDLQMYDPVTDQPAMARTSNLNEELGQVKHIFSDKTGTLTKNVMVFKGCSIAGKKFGGVEDLSPSSSVDSLESQVHPVDSVFDRFLTLLAVCHTVVPEVVDTDMDEQSLRYRASSPDENALVQAARQFGYVFNSRTPEGVTVNVKGTQRTYTVLHVLEFTSSRKRMSVIVEDASGKLTLMTKGADTVIYERLSADSSYKAQTIADLEIFAQSGLRTLCLAYADLDPHFYNTWKQEYYQASVSLEDRERKLDEVSEKIEKDLFLLGATAVEDKLQDGVPETIANLMKAKIAVWILTGDKQETAINIGYSCKLLTEDQSQLILDGSSLDETRDQLSVALQQFVDLTKSQSNIALIINGTTLDFALSCGCRKDFLDIALSSVAVICCRVSPWQKAEVVRLVRGASKDVTLAIGDGANDVGMIQAAHIGVGIYGLEGMQAACSSDYAISQFRFLNRLLFVHGAWNFHRVTKVILYSFYKNICLFLIQFWFTFVSGFSGQIFFERWSMALYNVAFTAAPPLALGLFDRNCKEDTCLKFPELYADVQASNSFNFKLFLIWVLNAAFHSAVLFSIPIIAFTSDVVYGNGQTANLLVLGNSVYTYVVVTVCLKAGLEHTAWTVFSHLAIWGSVVLWFLFLAIYSHIYPALPLAQEMVGMDSAVYGCPTFWFCLILVPLLALTRDFAWKIIKRSMSQSIREQVMYMEHLNLDPSRIIPVPAKETLSTRPSFFRLMRLRHHRIQLRPLSSTKSIDLGGSRDLGYAFSQEERGVVLQSELIRRYNSTIKKPEGR